MVNGEDETNHKISTEPLTIIIMMSLVDSDKRCLVSKYY